MKLFLIVMSFVFSFHTRQTLAHDDHDHGVPGTLQPQKGGRIKPALGGYAVELVFDRKTNNLKFYPMDKDYKPVPLSDVKLDITVQRRRVDKEPIQLVLKAHDDHLMGTFDPKGRFPFNVDVKTHIGGKDDTMQMIIDRN